MSSNPIICKIYNLTFRYPEQIQEIRQKLLEFNQLIMGACSQEGDSEGWSNFTPPNSVGILYEKIDSQTYKRVGTVNLF